MSAPPVPPKVLEFPFSQLAVITGLRLRIFAHLADGPVTAIELAERAAISPRGAQALLDMLVALGLASVSAGGVYRNSEFADARLVPGRPGSNADNLLEYYEAILALWLKLTEHVQTGKAACPPDSAQAVRFWRVFTLLYATGMTPLVAQAVKASGLTHGALHVLDVGGGAAALWGAAILAANPDARVTQLDLPEVNRDAAARVRAAGHADRFGVIDGDFQVVELPSASFDVAVIANVLHHWDAGTNQRLLVKLRNALRPGGRLVVVATPPDDGRTGSPYALMVSLVILPFSDQGRNYSHGEIERMVTGAGFAPPSFTAGESMTVFVARRDPP